MKRKSDSRNAFLAFPDHEKEVHTFHRVRFKINRIQRVLLARRNALLNRSHISVVHAYEHHGRVLLKIDSFNRTKQRLTTFGRANHSTKHSSALGIHNELTKASMTDTRAAPSPAPDTTTASATAVENTARLSCREGLLYSISSWRDRAATYSRPISIHKI